MNTSESDYKLKLSGMYIELTSSCNMQCPYCYNDSGNSGIYLDKKYIFKLLDELSERKIYRVVFSGGEPFLHKDIYELIKYSVSRNIKTTIISNLSLLSQNDMRALLCDNIALQVTYDDISPVLNDASRGKGSFDKNSLLLSTAKELNCLDKVEIRFNISKNNYIETEDFVKYIKGLGYAKVHFSFLHKSGRGTKYTAVFDYKEDVLLLKKILTDLQNLKEHYEDSANITYGELDKGFGCAFFGSGNIECSPRIDPNGNVFLCQLFSGAEKSLGNIKECSSVDRLLGSDTAYTVTDRVRSRKSNLLNCKSCPFDEVCMGGCPAIAYNTTHDINGLDGQCHMIKYTLKQRLANLK